MNPSSIKKIINKKVTLIALKVQLPTKKRHSPIFLMQSLTGGLLLTYNK